MKIQASILAVFCTCLVLLFGPVRGGLAQGPPQPGRETVPQASPRPLGMLTPEWIPLPPDHEKYLNEVLAYWEHKTGKIERYRCRFERFEYDPMVAPNTNIPKTKAKGVIKFAAPDKGLFHVEQLDELVLPLTPGEQPRFQPVKQIVGEHWICDGKSTFEFDERNKQLIQRELPPEQQGLRISDGPLPFMFGAKAEATKNRFWIHVVIPPPREKYFWLEAVPKTQQDAANFKKAHIVIAEKDYLPEAIILEHRNDSRTVMQFTQREANWIDIIEKINVFHREFFAPATPPGWKKVVERQTAPPNITATLPPRLPFRPAQRPQGTIPR